MSIPRGRKLWEKHENTVLNVFRQALLDLRQEDVLSMDEDQINELLCIFTRQASFREGLSVPPRYELPNQPCSKEDLGVESHMKRPDFSCSFTNHHAKSHEDAFLEYHIECKILGPPKSRSWVYNENYFKNGMRRFLDRSHRYGFRVPSGAMVGYVINSDFKCAHDEVSLYTRKANGGNFVDPAEGIHIPPKDKWAKISDCVFEVKQTFKRKQLDPCDFSLNHIWISFPVLDDEASK